MRGRSVVLAGAIVVAGGLSSFTATAADSSCVQDPIFGEEAWGVDTANSLSTKDEQVRLSVYNVTLEQCPGTTVTLRSPTGGTVAVPLSQYVEVDPPNHPQRIAGTLTLPLSTGAGTWQITKIVSGTSTRTLHHPFTVQRAGVVTLDTPAPVAAPAKASVSGQVRHYTATGALVPSHGATGQVHEGNRSVANFTSGTDGRFRVDIALPVGTNSLVADVYDETYSYGQVGTADAVVTQALQPAIQVPRLVRSSTAYVNKWWRVDGTATPGNLWHELQIGPGESSGSFGYSASNGTFTRWWKPTRTGTFLLRVELGQAGVQPNGPQYRDFTVAVKSKQTVPTYLDGIVAPTSGGTVYRGTTMSSYGHLRARYSSGKIGPFAGQRVAIQRRSGSSGPWYTIATSAPTTSNGYFLMRWPAPSGGPVQSPATAPVRFLYLSPYETIKDATLDKGSIIIYP